MTSGAVFSLRLCRSCGHAVLANLGMIAERARRALPVALTLTLLVLLAVFLASTYVGDARSPYGVCYGANGRAVPCAWIDRR